MAATTRDVASCVEWLIEKGSSLGFHAVADYMSPEDGLVAEASWALNPGQKPIFTFNVGSDVSGLYTNVLQWAGSSTEPKSWIHVGVLIRGPYELEFQDLPPRLRIIVFDVIQLSAKLEELARKVARLLAINTGVEPSASLPTVICAIARATDRWPTGQPNARLEFAAKIIMSPESLNVFAAEAEEDEVAEHILAPSRKVVPLEITAGGAVFDGALIRLIEADEGHFLFSSEHRNLPFTFRFYIDKTSGNGSISLWFDVDKSNLPQATEFWELAVAAHEADELRLSGSNGVVATLNLK